MKALSREIKFRAFTKWNNKMRYDITRIDFGTSEDFNGNPILIDFEEPNNAQGMSTGIALMQYTGLHDKNGKEICEGDVVELQHWEPKRYEVVFNRGGFCLKFGEDSHFYPDIKYAEDSEVIGNIYEHPYLLTKENK